MDLFLYKHAKQYNIPMEMNMWSICDMLSEKHKSDTIACCWKNKLIGTLRPKAHKMCINSGILFQEIRVNRIWGITDLRLLTLASLRLIFTVLFKVKQCSRRNNINPRHKQVCSCTAVHSAVL